jgi:hypothetical protein
VVSKVNAVKRGSGKSEIIRVRVTANEDGYPSCRDVVTNRMLRIRAHPHLIVGETVVVEVDTRIAPARVVRVIGAPSSPSTIGRRPLRCAPCMEPTQQFDEGVAVAGSSDGANSACRRHRW